jgi:predicted aldo/keto reductase-like oxidoreductase
MVVPLTSYRYRCFLKDLPMKTRKLGRTGYRTSIVAFGSFALLEASEKEAEATIEMVLERGINHFDVSPMYGRAEEHIGAWIKRNGKHFYLGCKTHERTKEKAWESINRSLEKLNVDKFDLFQFHGVDDIERLDILFGRDGAIDAVLKAMDQGMVLHTGITGHVPPVQNEALSRFDFDTVMFPLNRIHAAKITDWNDYRPLLETAKKKDAGVFAIKTIAKGNWNNPAPPHKYNTWYEPFDDKSDIEKSLWYALGRDITSAVSSGDMKLLPKIIDAAEKYTPLSEQEENDIIRESGQYKPLGRPEMP